MKKTLENIGFLTICVIIAIVAFYVGKSKKAETQIITRRVVDTIYTQITVPKPVYFVREKPQVIYIDTSKKIFDTIRVEDAKHFVYIRTKPNRLECAVATSEGVSKYIYPYRGENFYLDANFVLKKALPLRGYTFISTQGVGVRCEFYLSYRISIFAEYEYFQRSNYKVGVQYRLF